MRVATRELTPDERTHLIRAAERGEAVGAILLYNNLNPLAVRWGTVPRGYQETTYPALATVLRDQDTWTPGGFFTTGSTVMTKNGADNFRVTTIVPAHSRVIAVNTIWNIPGWDQFIDHRDDKPRLTWLRVKIPPTMWAVDMHWPNSGAPRYTIQDAQVYSLSKNRIRAYDIGNVNQSGHICWGDRLSTMGAVPTLDHVYELFYGSPFNMDLQSRRFMWAHPPYILTQYLRRYPNLTEIPARCFLGRVRRNLGLPSRFMQGQVPTP